jgi:hypothetical protein
MTDEKICWVSIASERHVYCIKEKCMAWVPECPLNETNDDVCVPEDCLSQEREYLECKGGCRLI